MKRKVISIFIFLSSCFLNGLEIDTARIYRVLSLWRRNNG